jgi:hypothetical protein
MGRPHAYEIPHLVGTRFAAASGASVLKLHDTTEFIYGREDSEAIGIAHKQPTGYGYGRRRR